MAMQRGLMGRSEESENKTRRKQLSRLSVRNLCLSKHKDPFYSDAEKNGVSLLHGNSITFYKQEQLREDLFRRVFEYW